MASVGLALFTVLNESEFVVAAPFSIVGFALLAVGLPAYYGRERHWFGRLARGGFRTMAVGTLIVAVAGPIAEYGPGIAFLGFLFGLLVTTIGSLVFGIAMVRADAAPRAAAGLLIAALPVGLPLTLGFTAYVMGEAADPWGGPMAFYGLAWVALGYHLRAEEADG